MPHRKTCADCQLATYSYDIQLVDELNQPIAGVPYKLTVAGRMMVEGKTDAEGKLFEDELIPGSAVLTLDADKLAEVLQEPHRYLRESRDWAKDSQVKPLAEQQGREYTFLKLGELIDKIPTIPEWPEDEPLPSYHFPSQVLSGHRIVAKGKEHKARKFTFEVSPFRAWVLDLTHSEQYNLANAYNLALTSVLTYADLEKNQYRAKSGSIKDFFMKQMLDLGKLPNRINTDTLTAWVKDVPFKDRYTILGQLDSELAIDDSGNKNSPISNTQMFYVSNTYDFIIAWRGTMGTDDILTDLSYEPASRICAVSSCGQLHGGFWRAYKDIFDNNNLSVELKKLSQVLDQSIGKKFYIAGHSLGGALALIHASEKVGLKPCLYTYGMPRVFSRSALLTFPSFIHYRHINKDDPVTAIPPEADVGNPLFGENFTIWGSKALGYLWSIPTLLANPILDKMGKTDPFMHHGKVVHFYQDWVLPTDGRTAITQWQATFTPYLIPALNVKTEQAAETAIKNGSLFPANRNPSYRQPPLNGADHSSVAYSRFIGKRLREWLPDTPEHKIYQQQLEQFAIKLKDAGHMLSSEERLRHANFFQMEVEANRFMLTSLNGNPEQEKGLKRYLRYAPQEKNKDLIKSQLANDYQQVRDDLNKNQQSLKENSSGNNTNYINETEKELIRQKDALNSMNNLWNNLK